MFTKDAKELFSENLLGVVDEEVTEFPGGRLRFQASYWPAMLDDDFSSRPTLKPGTRVAVIGRIGICLLVRPL